MRRSLALLLTVPMFAHAADTARAPREQTLGKKAETTLDASLAGDITRKKEDTGGAPLEYDQFQLGVERQISDKRRSQIDSLQRIIELSGDSKETPDLLFRLGELYFEESRDYFFQANRKDDDLIRGLATKDVALQEKAKKEKTALMVQRDANAKLAVNQYTQIVQKYRDYPRTDEVLFFLAHNLMDLNEEKKALIAYGKLVKDYPKSRFVPDAYLAFGEYYFNNSKGRRDWLLKALEAYKSAANYPESSIYGFALYKQGWCHFNLTDYARAMDLFKATVLYGEFTGASALEKQGGTKGKNTLIREARADYVRAYERAGLLPQQAKENFSTVASNPDDRFGMMELLASLYYDAGKDREAALAYSFLIKEKPLIAKTPGWQSRIVDCVLRAGDKKQTVAQIRKLVKVIGDVESSGNVKTDADRKAMSSAKDLSERTLSNIAVNWHIEGRKTRDDDTFEYANEVYADYLVLFPDNKKSYDLRFYWGELLNDYLRKYAEAEQQYTQVVVQDGKAIDAKQKPGKWLPNAAFNAVYAADEVVRRAEQKGEIKPPSGADLKTVVPLAPQRKILIDACERYLKYLPRGEKRVEVEYKAAKLYYDHHRYDEAVFRFSEIALTAPDHKFDNGDRAGEIAANLVLDSYNALGDYKKVNEWARRFYANDKLATGKFKDDLAKVIEQSSFKLVSQLEEKKEYAAAAQAYLDFVKDFPRTQIADKALYNASTDFYRAHMLEKALGARELLFRNYPHSPLVPASQLANAEGYEAIADFEHAAEAYELYVNGFEKQLVPADKSKKGGKKKGKQAKAAPEEPKKEGPVWEESKAQIALFNAGVYREGLGQLRQALKDRERYLEIWPAAKDSETVALSIADLYERMNQHGKAVAFLEQRARDQERDPNKYLAAQARILLIEEQKLKNPRAVARRQKLILDYYDKLYRRQKDALEPAAKEAVARATYAKNEEQFQYYARQKLHWGKGPDPVKEFRDSIKQKGKSLDEINRLYTNTVAFGAAEPAICSLRKIGLAYENMADSVANAPMLRSLPPEAQEELKNQLEQQAQPIREKAADHFAAAVAKSRELGIRSDCATRSLQALRTTYRPAQYPLLLEELANPRQDRGVQPPPPQILTQVQPVVPGVVLKGTSAGLPPGRPVVTREPQASGNGRQDDTSDLRPGQRPADGRGSEVVPASATQPKKPAADAEPEDLRQ
ncbi:MAG TPA: tetratricopeptide repeat protein [Myxococcaceae bacterium]|nr:tetratricopeptide repeat protein [Myxococcaceae bacterium]